jgi:hypothetical protein
MALEFRRGLGTHEAIFGEKSSHLAQIGQTHDRMVLSRRPQARKLWRLAVANAPSECGSHPPSGGWTLPGWHGAPVPLANGHE